MCHSATIRIAAAVALMALAASAQFAPAWRRVGDSTLSLPLPSRASGPVTRVWFSSDGSSIFAATASGRVWSTADLEHWSEAAGAVPPAKANVAASAADRSRVYASGPQLRRSDDGGITWTTASEFRGEPLLGGPINDFAVSPAQKDEIVAATQRGVWRSTDGGQSWTGLNDNLPNLPVARLLAVPGENTELRFAHPDASEWVWRPGANAGWTVSDDRLADRDVALRALSAAGTRAEIVSAVRAGDFVYAGSSDGALYVTADGRNWRPSPPVSGAGSIVRIYADARDPQFAVAVTSSTQAARVLRTSNGGVFWDDISANLPSGAVRGVTADRLTGAVYVATSTGVYMTYTDPAASAPPAPWMAVRAGAAVDVMQDSAGNQLYVAGEETGIWATMAPHRLRDPRVVSAGDRLLKAAAPGALLSVIGARIDRANAGDLPASVLAASDTESQVQLPFEIAGSGVVVSLSSAAGRLQLGLPVVAASPSIFVDKDGVPLITNADSGLVLDASAPARSNARLQILATGLGRVTPAWPTGLPAPLNDPPRVVAPVRAYLDREPLEISASTLAPGYVGLYVVEVRLPALVDRGTAELYIEANGQSSNRVQLYLEP